jgi:hypothetical protein
MQPQQWLQDERVVNAAPERPFDVTAQITTMSRDEALSITDGDEGAERLYLNAVERGDAEPWDGPFTVYCEFAITAALDDCLDA